MITQLPAEEVTKVIGGIEYRFQKATLEVFQKLISWSQPFLPDPFRFCKKKIELINSMPVELRKSLADELSDDFKKAKEVEDLRGEFGDPDFWKFMGTPEAMRKQFYLCSRKYHPELTQEDSDKLFLKGLLEHGDNFWNEIWVVAQGKAEKTDAELNKEFLIEKKS